MTRVKNQNHPFRNGKNFFDGFFREDAFRPFFKECGPECNHTVPAVNIKETKDGFQIDLAAPGLSKGDFKINLEKEILTISVKQEVATDNEAETYRIREFSFNSFERSFRLPKTVDTEGIKARYKSGVLLLTLPKLEEAVEKGPREIEIN